MLDDDDVTTPDPETDEMEEEAVTEEPEESEDAEGEDGDEDSDEDSEEPELEEVEYEGKTYRLNKELKDALLRQSDYTRKTQTVAEERKALEAEKEAVRQHVETQRQHLKEHATLVALDERLEQFSKVDWATLNQQDPVKCQSLMIEAQQLERQRNDVGRALHQKEQEATLATQQEIAKRIEEGQAVLRKEIPNYGPELMSKLKDFALSQGYSAREVDSVIDPRNVKLLNLAYKGMQLEEAQRKTLKKKPAPEAMPVSTVKAKGKPDTRPRDSDSTDTWVKKRQAQLAARSR